MWFQQSVSKQYASFFIAPDVITFAHIEKKDTAKTVTMLSCQQWQGTSYAIQPGSMFNITGIGKFMHACIAKTIPVNRADIRICLTSGLVAERCIPKSLYKPSERATTKNISLSIDCVDFVGDTSDTCAVYTCDMPRGMLFQFELLCIMHNFSISCVSTATMAWAAAYYALHKEFSDALLRQQLTPVQNLSYLCVGIPVTIDPVQAACLVGLCLGELPYETS